VDSIDDARTVLNILSSPDSPLQTFLDDVSEQTTLARPAPAAAPGADGAADGGDGTADGGQSTDGAAPADGGTDGGGSGILGTDAQAGPAAPLPGQYVNDQFEALHALVKGEGGQPPQLDALIADMRALYEGLNALQAGDGTIPPALTEALQKLNESAGSLPEPIASIAADVMASTASLSAGDARNQINEIYLTTVQGLCEQALAGRYPFDANSQTQVSLGAFATMFAPGEMLDTFFQQNLAPHADTSKKPWTWKDAAEPLNLSIPALQQFERAAEIRRVFFAQGATPKLEFFVTPDVMSETINRAVLTIDGQELAYSFGPNTPLRVTWPGPPDNPPGASLELTPLVDGQPNRLSFQGQWGWFQMADPRLDVAEVQPGETPDTVKITISAGDRSATYDVRADGVTNPFNMPELREFRCPTTL
jgi:type VI secretion system protein ImpL